MAAVGTRPTMVCQGACGADLYYSQNPPAFSAPPRPRSRPVRPAYKKQALVKFSPKCLERGVLPFGTAPCRCYCGRLSFGQLDKVHLTGRHEVATRLRQSRVPKLLAISKPEPLKHLAD